MGARQPERIKAERAIETRAKAENFFMRTSGIIKSDFS
jgi:hypothetical protein